MIRVGVDADEALPTQAIRAAQAAGSRYSVTGGGEGLCGDALGGLPQGHRRAGAGGAVDVRARPVLRRRLRVPLETGGQDQVSGLGSDRDEAGS